MIDIYYRGKWISKLSFTCTFSSEKQKLSKEVTTSLLRKVLKALIFLIQNNRIETTQPMTDQLSITKCLDRTKFHLQHRCASLNKRNWCLFKQIKTRKIIISSANFNSQVLCLYGTSGTISVIQAKNSSTLYLNNYGYTSVSNVLFHKRGSKVKS